MGGLFIHFRRWSCFGRLFASFFCNGNAKFRPSLFCSLFTEFTGECNHPHVQSQFTANGSSECSSIHVSGDYQHRRKPLKANRQTDPRKGANDDAMQGFIPITNHASDHYSLSSVHSKWFTNHCNHIHTFTPITRVVATKQLSSQQKNRKKKSLRVNRTVSNATLGFATLGS